MSLFPPSKPGSSWGAAVPDLEIHPDGAVVANTEAGAAVVIDLDRRVTYADACTSKRARRVADRAVASSVRDLRAARNVPGDGHRVYAAYTRLCAAAARTIIIDAEEAAKQAARTGA